MPQITVQRLFEDNRDRLGISWIAGRDGGARTIDSALVRDQSHHSLIGHLNFVHSFLIQLIGVAESEYLAGLPEAALEAQCVRLFDADTATVVVANGLTAPRRLLEEADATHTAVLATAAPSQYAADVLRGYFAKTLAESTTMHGVFLDVLGMGVLVTGESGIGKSELALELISRGHGMVADDVVELYRVAPETVEARCPPLLRDFLEVRGLGMLNIRTIFGETAVRKKKNLKLIIHLDRPSGQGAPTIERLPLNASTQDVLGVPIRKVLIPVAAGRNLAVLVEAAVRNTILQLRGIDSTRDFVERHERQLTADDDED